MHKQRIIAMCNEKGGTAKTTTAVNLSAALGLLGQKVLLVDLDGQAASSRWLGVEEDNRLAEAMARGGGLKPIREVKPGLSLAPASGKLDSVAHDLRPTQGGQLRKVLSEIKEFDWIFIDCPPSLGNRLIGSALLAATHALVPVETSILALDGLKMLLTTLDDIRGGFDHEIVLGGVLACRYDGRTRLSRLVTAELRRALPGKVFDTVIRENVRMRECPASGQSIFEFAPESHSAEDYMAAAREMLANPQVWQTPGEGDAVSADRALTAEFSMTALRDRTAAMVCGPAETETGTEMASQVSAEPATEPADAPDAAGADGESVCVPIEGMDAVEVNGNEYRDYVGRLEQAERRLEDAPASAGAEGAGDECVEAEPSATGAGEEETVKVPIEMHDSARPAWQADVMQQLGTPESRAGEYHPKVWSNGHGNGNGLPTHSTDQPTDALDTPAQTEPVCADLPDSLAAMIPSGQMKAQDVPVCSLTGPTALAPEPPTDEPPQPEPTATDVETSVAEDQSDTDTDTDADAAKEHYPALRALVNKLRHEGQFGSKKAG